jgi:sugar phosphate isomerase/epimerase
MIGRRDFLSGSAAALTAPWLAATSAGPLEAAGPGFHLGCVTHTLFADYDLESIIRILEAAGFEGVELRTTTASPTGQKHGVEPSLSQAERARVRKRFESSKVKLVNLGSVVEFQSADAAERKRQVATGKTFVDLAKDLGAIGVKVRPYGWGTEPDHQVTTRRIGECLKELGEYAAPKNIQIQLEFHDEGHREDKQMMEIAGLKNVGLTWNSAGSDLVNGSVKPCFDILGRWVMMAHVHDPVGRKYPYREFFSLLHAAKFTGYTLYEGAAKGNIEDFLKSYKAWWVKTTQF